MYVSGSDGNLYLESTNGMFTGSLYKTKYIEISGSHTIEEDDVETVPGILYDQANNLYWLERSFRCFADREAIAARKRLPCTILTASAVELVGS